MQRARTGIGAESRVLDALGRVGETAASRKGDWRQSLCNEIRLLTGAELGIVGEIEGWGRGRRARPVRVTDSGFDDSRRAIFLEYLRDTTTRDPFLERIVAQECKGQTIERRALVPNNDWYRSAYVDVYRRTADVDDMMVAVIAPSASGTAFALGAHKAWGRGCFNAVEVHQFDLLRRTIGGWLAALAARQSHNAATAADSNTPAQRLSPRLAQVLSLIVSGRTEKQIAGELNLSVHTVHMHVRRLYAALGVANRAAAVREAVRLGRGTL